MLMLTKTMSGVLLITVVSACGGTHGDELFEDQALATITAGTAAIGASKKWTGTQSCMGSGDDLKTIDTTSAAATLDSFAKTDTHVSITGIDVGPNPEYSCTGLTFDGVVTDADKSHVSFETVSDDAMRQLQCSSTTGRALVVGWLRGYDSDLARLDGPWSVHFRVRIADPVDGRADAGVPSSRVDIQCDFDFMLE
jgi:hypothetical protein